MMFCYLICFLFSTVFVVQPIYGCSDCAKSDCSVNKYKCVDESPLCARLEPLCDNFFFSQWKDMRCACPKTCRLCTDQMVAEVPAIADSIPEVPQPPARCDPSTNPIDVGLVLDGSGSITRTMFDNQVLEFTKAFARQLDVSSTGHRMGIVQYGSTARTEITFGQFNSTSQLEAAIGRIRYMDSGSTMTGMGIQLAKNRLFDFSRSASKACVVITDGDSSDDVKGPADEMRRMGVHMIAVGAGADYNLVELNEIADDSSHVYTADNFKSLNSTLAALLNSKICQDAFVRD